jgi:signal transduction histidine kinase
MCVRNNQTSLYITFFRYTLITGISSMFVGLLLAYQVSKTALNSQESAKDVYYASAISQLLLPSLAISNYREIQNILSRLNNDFYEHAVIDEKGEIILADFTSFSLVKQLIPFKDHLDCGDIPTIGEYKYSNPTRIICASIDEKNITSLKHSQKSGLLLIFKRMNSRAIPLGAFAWLSAAFLFMILLTLGVLHFLAKKRLLKPLESLIKKISEAKVKGVFDLSDLDSEFLPSEYQSIISEVGNLYSLLNKKQKHQNELEQKLALGNLAAQVAHDIRSPLAAFNIIEHDLSELPEEKRILVRAAIARIRDIANNLIFKNQEYLNINMPDVLGQMGTTELSSIELLPEILEALITEKRIQYRSRIKMAIEIRFDSNSYGLFVDIQKTEFKRMLSNLIDNAVEALGESGNVDISLLIATPGVINIVIKDNGPGISKDILPQLMKFGGTFGKKGGTGLGLFHAKEKITSWGGQIEVNSEFGSGTNVVISLPKSKPPAWFTEKIILKSHRSIIILDDDISIHNIWNNRLEKIKNSGYPLDIVHLASADELEYWFETYPERRFDAIYLIDYELLGNLKTGLDVIEKLKIESLSTLVTSRFESTIRLRCERLGVKLLPKSMAGFIPVIFDDGRGLSGGLKHDTNSLFG